MATVAFASLTSSALAEAIPERPDHHRPRFVIANSRLRNSRKAFASRVSRTVDNEGNTQSIPVRDWHVFMNILLQLSSAPFEAPV